LNVSVVNTPSVVIASSATTLPISGSVNIVNTPGVLASIVSAPTLSVNVTNTPSVVIASSAVQLPVSIQSSSINVPVNVVNTPSVLAAITSDLVGLAKDATLQSTKLIGSSFTVTYYAVTSTASQIAASNANRVSLLIVNQGPNAISIGPASTVTATSGLPISPSGSLTINTTSTVYAISTSTATVIVVELTR
ncbi:MAG: hypothetical protein JZD41_02455, partial [Thermoproteus sp.]|nr:hypothetical protein [Thermoproteus sp.]